ncbi:MAG: redoxin domain-containing protein [Armatimonadota bacterium]|nr:redoxin domain-containing protein [bacterium]
MKCKVCLFGLVCILLASVVMTGCGRKSTSVKRPEKVEKRVASKIGQPKAVKHPSAKGTDSKSPTGDAATGLPFGVEQTPSALDQALNPLAALGSSNAVSSKVPSAPGSVKAMPRAGMIVPSKMGRPKPEQLLAVVQMRYRSAKTFRTLGTSTGTVKADGKFVRKTTDPKSAFLFKRPNKFMVNGSDEQLVTNGKTVARYSPAAGRYVKSPLNKDTEKRLLQSLIGSQMGVRSLGLLMGVDYSSMASSMKLLDDAKIGGRDTFVLRINLKQGVACPKGMAATQTLWIGKKDMGIYKNCLVIKGKPQLPKGFKGKAPRSVETTVSLTATKCEFDSNIPDSKFSFTPPAGAKAAEDPRKNYLQDKQATDFAFTWTDGSRKKLSDFRGQVVMIDCWGLPMCEKHLPVLQKIYEKHKDSVQLVSICLNDDKAKVGKYLSEKGLNFPVVYGDEQIAEMLQSKYHVQILPTIYIIDKSGVVRQRLLGQPDAKDIEAALNKIP